VTETWLNARIPTEAVDIAGYVFHRHDRADGRQGGGVGVYVGHNISCVRLADAETPLLETLWLLFRCKRMPRSLSHLLIGVVYHPPDAVNRTMSDHLVDTIDALMKCHPSAGVILLGDFNQLYDAPLRDYPLKQIVRSATRGTSTLDKVYTSAADWYLPPIILPNIAGSDHASVLVQALQNNVKRGREVAVTVRSNDSNGKVLLAHALKSVNWSPLYRMTDVDSMTTFFNSTITTLIDRYLPERVVVRHTSNKPWVTEKFCRLIRQRQHAWTTGNMDRYRSLRNRIVRLSRSLRQNYYHKRVQNLRRCNASNWWRETKRLTGQSNKSDLSGLADSVCDGDVQQLTNIINKSLQQVSADLQPLTTNDFAMCDSIPCQYTIYPEEVYDKLSRINTRKAPGPDQLPNWILKEFAFLLCDPICCIFNTSVQHGIVPTLWKSANVVPIPKVTPARSIESDLRPISLTPTLSKILESFIGGWMLETVCSKFDPKQFGGLKGRSTTHALIDILHQWHSALDGGNSVRVLFIDYAKAFDHIDHTLVLRRMVEMGVPDFIIQWTFSFLSSRRQRVKIGQYVSNWLTLNGSMPQGTWLGLYIFLMVINSLAASIPLHKYVDDVTITETLARSKPSVMQMVLDDVTEWSINNLMNINYKKTKEMLIGTISKDPPSALTLGGNEIERVTSFKLLGATISETLNWDENTSTICSKAAKRLHFLKLLKRSGMSTEDLTYYYSTVVRPVLEYCSIVWNTSLTEEQSDRLEHIQRRAERIIGLTDEANKLPTLKKRRDEQTKRFFNSILQSSSCLHHLLPPKRDIELTDRLRYANTFEIPFARTERFKNSFLINALANYQ